MARNAPTMPANDIVVQVKTGLDEGALVGLPRDPSLKRAINRARMTAGGTGMNKLNAHEIELSDEFVITIRGDEFMMIDSRVVQPGEPVFFIYASDLGVTLLREYRNWAIDGTFYCCPPSFKQLFTINVFKGDSSLPTAYFLLPGKSAEVYSRAFGLFFNNQLLAGVSPMSVMSGKSLFR